MGGDGLVDQQHGCRHHGTDAAFVEDLQDLEEIVPPTAQEASVGTVSDAQVELPRARHRVPAWIEEYNHDRRHSALGMLSPVAYELQLH